MARVSCASSELRAFTGGLDAIDVQASDVRGLIAELQRRFPGLGEHVERRMAIAIDGEIHQDALGAPLAPGSEVVLIPRIAGG
jgi:molybdopterin converting factor small subunit